MVPVAQRLSDALLALPPREAQLVLRAARAERPLEAISTAHGVDPARAAVLLWEALGRLDAQLRGARWRPPAWPKAQAQAAAVQEALAATTPSNPSAQRFFELRRELAAVQEALAAAHRREDEAPARTVEAWLRRLAIVAILAITAWSYLRH